MVRAWLVAAASYGGATRASWRDNSRSVGPCGTSREQIDSRFEQHRGTFTEASLYAFVTKDEDNGQRKNQLSELIHTVSLRSFSAWCLGA